MKDLISQLEKETFELKDPWRATNKSMTIIVPIVAKVPGTREYVVLEEVKDKVKITDTGRIDSAKIEGNVDQPTFIRGGTMLKGATQERAAQFGIVVIPQNTEQIPIHCIHASKGIYMGASFFANDVVPSTVNSAMLSMRSQASTWDAASSYGMRMRAGGPIQSNDAYTLHGGECVIPYDDLARTSEAIQKFRTDLNEILKQIPDYVNQVGSIIVDPDGVLGMEVYDHPDSWGAFAQVVHKSFSEALAKEDKLGIFKPDMEAIIPVIRKFILELDKMQEEEVFNGNDARTAILKAEGYVGEFTSLKGKTIHLLITRIEKESERIPTGIPAHVSGMRAGGFRDSRPFFEHGYTTSVNLSMYTNSLEDHSNYPLGDHPKKRKRNFEILRMLDSPKTWTKLNITLPMSKATLSDGLKDLQRINAIEKRADQEGTFQYSRTGIGCEILKRRETQ